MLPHHYRTIPQSDLRPPGLPLRRALFLAAWLPLLAAAPAQAALTDGWPQLTSGGRRALLTLMPQLERQAMLLVAAAADERKACETARNKGHGCGEPLQGALLQLQSVAQGLDEMGKALGERLASPPAAELEADARACAAKVAEACHRQAADNASLDAFAQLRVVPALERLARLAAEADKALVRARADRDADTQKLPKKKEKPGQHVQLEPPLAVGADRRDEPPPPPPPPKVWLKQCTSAKPGKTAKGPRGAVCADIAQVYELRKEPEKALEFWKLACKQGHATACAKLGPQPGK
ncbi:MAG: hypothetical protein HY902_21270 [Deltaproteobacteria bacterium]|nr:hypothetical protein [Deltaproteobacteria bacterium]